MKIYDMKGLERAVSEINVRVQAIDEFLGANDESRLSEEYLMRGTFKEDNYKYDELGQIAQEVKTINVPNVGQRTFATTYRYDSFGRILGSVYPDGDSVTYSYYPSGELSGISSKAVGTTQSIIDEIYYDGRGNIDELHYGNGTSTSYEYADRTWTLMGSTVTGSPSGSTSSVSLLKRDYEYNSLGAISSIQRNMHSSLVQGGETQHTFSFTYDAFNRLLDGSMTMNNVSGTAYQVATAFNDAGGILSKTSTVNTASSTLSGNASAMGYDLTYNYNQAKPHQLEVVVDQVSGNTQQFVYNESGSIKQIQDNTQNQEFYWNEEQWLNAVRNDQGIHHYVYDDKGERIMKSSVIQTNVFVNDQIVSTIQDLQPYTLYVNPYFVITEFSNADNVSKHYYMGTQRVASELAVQTTEYSPMVGNTGSSSGAASTAEAYKTLINASNTIDQGLESQLPVSSNDPWLDNLNAALTEFGEVTLTRSDVGKGLPTIESIYPDLSPQSSYKTTSTARVIYWYHPDYIGNVDLVTDMSGQAYEFFLYNPWGENLYEWNSGTNTWTSPYRFNGKELDQETGFHYYGARYHEPKLSVWMSVDPLSQKTKESYQYLLNSPLIINDNNGMAPTVNEEINNVVFSYVDEDNQTIIINRITTMVTRTQENGDVSVTVNTTEIMNAVRNSDGHITHGNVTTYSQSGSASGGGNIELSNPVVGSRPQNTGEFKTLDSWTTFISEYNSTNSIPYNERQHVVGAAVTGGAFAAGTIPLGAAGLPTSISIGSTSLKAQGAILGISYATKRSLSRTYANPIIYSATTRSNGVLMNLPRQPPQVRSHESSLFDQILNYIMDL